VTLTRQKQKCFQAVIVIIILKHLVNVTIQHNIHGIYRKKCSIIYISFTSLEESFALTLGGKIKILN